MSNKFLDGNGVAYLWGKVDTKIQTDIAGKADSSSTLGGYGITDAKIEDSKITLGGTTLEPLTEHQDISGKANLSGAVFTGNVTVPKLITSTGLEIY